MNDVENVDIDFFRIKIIQSGEIKKFPLTEAILKKNFKEIYLSVTKECKMTHKDTFLSNESGKMVGSFDLNLSLKEIIEKFGNNLNLYYEKIM